MRLSRREALILMGGVLGAGACRPDAEALRPISTPEPVPPAAGSTAPPEPRGAPTIAPSAERTAAPYAAPVPTAAPTLAAPATSPAPTEAAATPAPVGVVPGIDVLLRERKDLLAGKRLGLIT